METPPGFQAREDAPFSEDRLLGGRVRLRQPRRGYRAGMDAALLAAACGAGPGERVLDLGCGPGAVLLAAAARRPGARFTGMERDPDALALARANIALNGLDDRAEAFAGEVSGGFASLGRPRFDEALCNPPFFDDPTALRGPSADRAGAWLAEDGLRAWIGFLLSAVHDGGRIVLIHRADRLAEILTMLSPKAGSFRIRPVHAFAEAPAKRVLVQAIRAGKAPLVLLPALVLHDRSGAKHTTETDLVLRGDAELGWE